MMTSSSGFACGCSAWPRSSATCGRRAASSGSTPRPTTAGGARCSGVGSRCSGPGSVGHRACPTRRASSSSSGCSRLPWGTRVSGHGGSARRSPRSAGAASSSAPTASGGGSPPRAQPADQPPLARRGVRRATRARDRLARARHPAQPIRSLSMSRTPSMRTASESSTGPSTTSHSTRVPGSAADT
jgi:hypothetical protein